MTLPKNKIGQAVRQMLDSFGVYDADIALLFTSSIQVWRNKISSGKFSVKELSMIASLTGWNLVLMKDDEIIKLDAKEICTREDQLNMDTCKQTINDRHFNIAKKIVERCDVNDLQRIIDMINEKMKS